MPFYVDRDEGFIWCARCVPAAIGLLSQEYDESRKSGRRQERFMQADALRATPFLAIATVTVALRCCECGAIESSA